MELQLTEKKRAYRFQPLLYMKNGEATGAMSPVMFAQLMCKQWKVPFTGLCRVWFEDEELFQVYESGFKQGLTGHDMLAIYSEWKNCYQIAFFIDCGVNGLPVACIWDDDTAAIITPIFRKQTYEKILTDEQIQVLMLDMKENKDEVFKIINEKANG